MTDVVARLRGALAPGSDSPAPIRLSPGGAAANTAAWLAENGTAVSLVARVGTDVAGTAAIEQLRSEGVECVVTHDPGLPTGTCIVLVAPDGERTMVPDAGANAGLLPEDVPETLFDERTHLHLSGYALLDPGARAAARHALAFAAARGTSTSVDPASAAPLLTLGPDRFLGWVEGVGTILANEEEAEALTGCSDPSAAAVVLGRAFAEVVVKLGGDGALWHGRGVPEPVHVPAEPTAVVDTTGAGDAFAAGWLAARLAGAEPAAALRSGCAVAARVVAQVGARPSG
jgi:sugar/nucleoside kinase (ribokinase family)